MAQELFISKETRERARREQLIKKGLQLWRDHAEEYRVLPYKYFFYLTEKKIAGIKLNKICSTFCTEENYPEIPLFRILHTSEALAWLSDKTTEELEAELDEIVFVIGGDYLYRSMREWVAEAIYLLSHDKPHPFSLAMGTSSEIAKPKHTPSLVTVAE